jgi:hypothetical protein
MVCCIIHDMVVCCFHVMAVWLLITVCRCVLDAWSNHKEMRVVVVEEEEGRSPCRAYVGAFCFATRTSLSMLSPFFFSPKQGRIEKQKGGENH